VLLPCYSGQPDSVGPWRANPFSVQKEEKRMRLKRIVVILAAAASLSLGLPQAATYAASAAPAKAVAASTAQTGSHSVRVLSPAIPNIKWQECAGKTTTWVDLDAVNIGAGVIDDWCYGYTGIWNFPVNPPYYISIICAGNNYGSFRYIDHNTGVLHTWDFAPGHVLAGTLIPVRLTITGWSGSDTCKS
jgi:hypothetical protein